MFTQVYEPKGYRFTFLPRRGDLDRARGASRRADAVRLARDADEPAAQHRRHRRRRRRRARRRARSSSSTTPSRRRTSSSRSSSAPTSSLHSTTKYLGGHSDVVGGFVATNDPRSRSDSPSCRSRSARCRGRSTAGSSSAALKTLAVRMDRHCENASAIAAFLEDTLAWNVSSIRVCPRIPGTRSQRARCATSAGWCRSSSRTSRKRSTSSRARRSGSSPRASAASRA